MARKTELERAASALGRKGGKAKSEAKTRAAKRNILTRWAKVKAKKEPPHDD